MKTLEQMADEFVEEFNGAADEADRLALRVAFYMGFAKGITCLGRTMRDDPEGLERQMIDWGRDIQSFSESTAAKVQRRH